MGETNCGRRGYLSVNWEFRKIGQKNLDSLMF